MTKLVLYCLIFFLNFDILHNMKSINERIATNLVILRKNAGLTQLEFANKLNYSNKAISKWEKGESIPSVETLEQICLFFNITLNDLTSEIPYDAKKKEKNLSKLSANKVIIICMLIVATWFISTILFVYDKIINDTSNFMYFLWALPSSLLITLIFNYLWENKKSIYPLVSLLIWSLLLCIHLQFLSYNLWAIYIIGIPLQIAVILWSQLNKYKKQEEKYLNLNKENKL